MAAAARPRYCAGRPAPSDRLDVLQLTQTALQVPPGGAPAGPATWF